MELKEQIKGELFKQKEEKLKKEKELNSKLKKITLYTLAKNTVCENYKKTYNVRHFANPDYVNPPFEARLLESIKNLNQNISKTFQGMNRQLAPISKLMNDIMKDVEKEKKPIKKSE